ncbi:MAG: hypothetical protein IT340_05580 [Chloroflexi bacterium]|nr:hypothetical protein [Chloroflexota bacterium]
MILGTISLLLTGLVVLVFISAALAPLESLRWWAGWQTDEDTPDENAAATGPIDAAPAATAEPLPDQFVVYLSGIGAIANDSVPQEEVPFIAGLAEQLPNARVVSNVFPYSVTNQGLTGQRAFANLWRWIEGRRLKDPTAAAALIVNLRNAFQVAVSADQRYGPIYNLGVAKDIRNKLVAAAYPVGSGIPVTIVGWSGGGQIAVGAANFLPALLGAPLYVVSLGGLLSDDGGIKQVEHLWHLYGTKDVVSPIGLYAYAGRWRIYPNSAWNQAVAAGKVTFIDLGPMTHNGAGNYFDAETRLPDEQPYLDHTLTTIAQVLTEQGLR